VSYYPLRQGAAGPFVEILPRLEKEAKERQRLSRGRGKKGTAKLQHLFGESSEHAAKLVNVSARTVKTAKALKKADAGLYWAVILLH
jgi:hypothetical protein